MTEDEKKVLIDALEICASHWGWWDEEDPPIVSYLPKHPIISSIIDKVRKRKRSKYTK